MKFQGFIHVFMTYRNIIIEMLWIMNFFEIVPLEQRRQIELAYIKFHDYIAEKGKPLWLNYVRDVAADHRTKNAIDLILTRAQSTDPAGSASRGFLSRAFGGFDKNTVYATMGWPQT